MNKKFKEQNKELLEKELDNVAGGLKYVIKKPSDFKTDEEYQNYKVEINRLSQEFDPRYFKR